MVPFVSSFSSLPVTDAVSTPKLVIYTEDDDLLTLSPLKRNRRLLLPLPLDDMVIIKKEYIRTRKSGAEFENIVKGHYHRERLCIVQ